MVSVRNRFIIIVVDSRLLIILSVLNNIKALLILLFLSFGLLFAPVKMAGLICQRLHIAVVWAYSRGL